MSKFYRSINRLVLFSIFLCHFFSYLSALKFNLYKILKNKEASVTCLSFHQSNVNILLAGYYFSPLIKWNIKSKKAKPTVINKKCAYGVNQLSWDPISQVPQLRAVYSDGHIVTLGSNLSQLCSCTIKSKNSKLDSYCFDFNQKMSWIIAKGSFCYKNVELYILGKTVFSCLEKDGIGPVSCVKWSAVCPDLIASGSYDNMVRIWKIGLKETKWHYDCLQELCGHSDYISCLAWHPSFGHILASGSADGTIILWDVEKGKCLNILKSHCKGVSCLAFHHVVDNVLISGSKDGILRMWDLKTGDCSQFPDKHPRGVTCLTFSASGSHLATGDASGNIFVWDCLMDSLKVQNCSNTLRK